LCKPSGFRGAIGQGGSLSFELTTEIKDVTWAQHEGTSTVPVIITEADEGEFCGETAGFLHHGT
jgi:hypothetical protein